MDWIPRDGDVLCARGELRGHFGGSGDPESDGELSLLVCPPTRQPS